MENGERPIRNTIRIVALKGKAEQIAKIIQDALQKAGITVENVRNFDSRKNREQELWYFDISL